MRGYGNSRKWNTCLFQEYHVVAIDMRGYGDSSKPAGVNNYTMDLLVEDVRALVLALGVERSPILNINFAFAVIRLVRTSTSKTVE